MALEGDISEAVRRLRQDEVTNWVEDIIKPNDSVSQTGKSSVSSTTSSKVKLMAKKASLLAKAKMLEPQQALKRRQSEMQMQQAEIELEQERLALECEIQATDAEEKVYERFEYEMQQTSMQIPLDTGRYEPLRQVHSQNIDKPFEQNHTFNPFVGPWVGRDTSHIVHQNAGTSGETGGEKGMLLMQQKVLDVMQLPKSELMKFNGDPLQYWIFIRSFETNVDQTSVSSGAKLNRLLSYCTGKALTVIECCAVMEPEEGYKEARRLLKNRFGSEHVISNAWIQKITEGSVLRPVDAVGLRTFADDLRSAMLTLKAMGKVNEINNQIRMVKIVTRLPAYLQGRWRKMAVDNLNTHGIYPNIEQLVNLVLRAADEANDPIFGVTIGNKVKDENTQVRPRNSFERKQYNYSVQTGAEDASSDRRLQFPTPKCPLCSGGHALFMCFKFKELKPEKRHEFVVEKKLCFNCFMKNHMSRDCRKPSKCMVQGCTRKHSR